MVTKPLDKEYQYYLSNKKTFYKDHYGRCIALKDKQVVMSGEDKQQVVEDMLSAGHKLGSFLVHQVSKESDSVKKFYSRIY